MNTNLAKKMLDMANADELPTEHELRTKAVAFDAAAKGFYGDPQTCDVKSMLGCYARARRAWCDYTGEDLV